MVTTMRYQVFLDEDEIFKNYNPSPNDMAEYVAIITDGRVPSGYDLIYLPHRSDSPQNFSKGTLARSRQEEAEGVEGIVECLQPIDVVNFMLCRQLLQNGAIGADKVPGVLGQN